MTEREWDALSNFNFTSSRLFWINLNCKIIFVNSLALPVTCVSFRMEMFSYHWYSFVTTIRHKSSRGKREREKSEHELNLLTQTSFPQKKIKFFDKIKGGFNKALNYSIIILFFTKLFISLDNIAKCSTTHTHIHTVSQPARASIKSESLFISSLYSLIVLSFDDEQHKKATATIQYVLLLFHVI